MALRLIAFSVSACLSLFASSLSHSAESHARVQDIVICKSPAKESASGKNITAGRSVRTLRIYETKEKNANGETADGCRATYTKTNVELTVGTSRQLQHCQSILNGIQKNLEASNWSCRRAGPIAVMRSSAAEASEAMVDARVLLIEESVIR